MVCLYKVGILRGSSLNPYEGQYFKELPKFGFQPIGISTIDNAFSPVEIPFPVRLGQSYKTLTKGRFIMLQRLAKKATKYNFESYNFMIYNLRGLTKDLDIIHSADIEFPYTYQAARTSIPTVVTEWENIPFNFEELPYSRIKNYNRKHVAYFIAITERAKKALILEGTNPDRITVIPAGVDCEIFKPQSKNVQIMERLGVAEENVKILFVGRLVPEKGIFNLLSAFSMLLKSKQNVELLIVGSGNQETTTQIKELVTELKIGLKVKFLGNIKYSEMPQIHNIADIFCLPSEETKTWAEQFGYSLVEAMACGKPAVSTWTGSIPEIIKHRQTGILVKPNEPDSLKSALEELLEDKAIREKFGSNGREWVLERFEANKVAGQIADVYHKVLKT
ncbi:MAG: glycosyltransferase family 4 protein [Bacillota bacterium]